MMYYLPEYTTVQLLPDRFYPDSGPETPYLTAHNRRIRFSGPDGMLVRSLGDGVLDVVYTIPHDVTRFVTASCGPYLRPLPTRSNEVLPVLRLAPGYDLRISRSQLHCLPPGARPSG